jgi:hypothetical protein
MVMDLNIISRVVGMPDCTIECIDTVFRHRDSSPIPYFALHTFTVVLVKMKLGISAKG